MVGTLASGAMVRRAAVVGLCLLLAACQDDGRSGEDVGLASALGAGAAHTPAFDAEATTAYQRDVVARLTQTPRSTVEQRRATTA